MKDLKTLRSIKKISQVELADRLGIPQSTYSSYENNKSKPDIDTIIKLAEFYNITTDELLDRKIINLNLEALEPEVKTLIQKILKMNNTQKAQTITFVNALTMFD